MSFIVTSPISPGSFSPGSGLTPGVSARSFAAGAANYAIGRYGPQIVNAVQSRLDSAVNSISDNISGKGATNSNNSDSGKSDGGKSNSSGNGKGSGGSGGRRASRSNGSSLGPGGSPNVVGVPQLSLNSGIDSGTIINPLQDVTDHYSPIFIQCGQLLPNKAVQLDSSFSKLFNEELFYKYKILVISEINYGLARLFTEQSFYEYIEVLSYALQLYYMVDSLLAYTSHSPNENIGMTRLRMAINPDISNGHIKLREFLEGTPIPPNMLVYIRHMYQNYSFTDVVGSPIIRLSLQHSLCTAENNGALNIDGSTYAKVFSDLIKCSDTSSIIKKIRSNWVTKMPASSYEALFDPQFSTFWHNSNIAYEDFGSKVVKYTIEAKSQYDPLYYGMFGNRLDGLIYASCSVVNEHKVMEMGLWAPFIDFDQLKSTNCSLLCMSNDKVMRPVTSVSNRIASMIHAAPNTRVTPDKNLIWELSKCSYVGACVPQAHSLSNVKQAITRSVHWLLAP